MSCAQMLAFDRELVNVKTTCLREGHGTQFRVITTIYAPRRVSRTRGATMTSSTIPSYPHPTLRRRGIRVVTPVTLPHGSWSC